MKGKYEKDEILARSHEGVCRPPFNPFKKGKRKHETKKLNS